MFLSCCFFPFTSPLPQLYLHINFISKQHLDFTEFSKHLAGRKKAGVVQLQIDSGNPLFIVPNRDKPGLRCVAIAAASLSSPVAAPSSSSNSNRDHSSSSSSSSGDHKSSDHKSSSSSR
jgi:hypothetical protein